jgi:hypothetical protein
MGGEGKNIANITRQGEMTICHQLSANMPPLFPLTFFVVK